MPVHQQVWDYFRHRRTAGRVGKSSAVAVLAVVLTGLALNTHMAMVQDQPRCVPDGQVQSLDDTVDDRPLPYGIGSGGAALNVGNGYEQVHSCSAVNARHTPRAVGESVQGVVDRPSQPMRQPQPTKQLQRITLPQPVQTARSVARPRVIPRSRPIPTSVPRTHVHRVPAPGIGRGIGNAFPYGQCTWWANQRYFQLHGVYVPWRTGADAWQWSRRALQFGWHVSSHPSVGAIIDLQPGVEGAYGLGHVAVVERILGGGSVLASTMNWGAYPSEVQYVQYTPGPGVTFITQ